MGPWGREGNVAGARATLRAMSTPLITCPVCFTQQPNAWDCAVCGVGLHDKPRHWAVPLEPVEGLEITSLETAGNVAVEAMPDLETTALDDGVEPLPESVDELETTAFEPVQALPPSYVPEFEPTALDAREPGAEALAAVACRYCGTPWPPGSSIFCGRCGMRVGSRAPASSAAVEVGGEAACRACGSPGQPLGGLCGDCGQPVVR